MALRSQLPFFHRLKPGARGISPLTGLDFVSFPRPISPTKNNSLLAVNEQADQLGCSFLDISTGEFRTAQFSGEERWNRLLLDVEHLAPREVLFPERMKESVHVLAGIAKTSLADWLFD